MRNFPLIISRKCPHNNATATTATTTRFAFHTLVNDWRSAAALPIASGEVGEGQREREGERDCTALSVLRISANVTRTGFVRFRVFPQFQLKSLPLSLSPLSVSVSLSLSVSLQFSRARAIAIRVAANCKNGRGNTAHRCCQLRLQKLQCCQPHHLL